MGAWIDITGQTFGCWRVIRYAGKERWECECTTCGTIHLKKIYALKTEKRGQCFSCYLKSRITHGHSLVGHVTRTYTTWSKMLARCRNPDRREYRIYGGRGISVCERWNDFKNFLADMGEKPIGLSIERINNDGNYEPFNCRWATRSEQANNRRTNKIVSVDGEVCTATQAAKKVGCSKGTIWRKLKLSNVPEGIIPFVIPIGPPKHKRHIKIVWS